MDCWCSSYPGTEFSLVIYTDDKPETETRKGWHEHIFKAINHVSIFRKKKNGGNKRESPKLKKEAQIFTFFARSTEPKTVGEL